MQPRQNLKHFLILLLRWGKGYKEEKRDIGVLIPEAHFTDNSKVCISMQAQPRRSLSLQIGNWKIQLEQIVRNLKISMRTKVVLFHKELHVLPFPILFLPALCVDIIEQLHKRKTSSEGILVQCYVLNPYMQRRNTAHPLSFWRPPIRANRTSQPHKDLLHQSKLGVYHKKGKGAIQRRPFMENIHLK